MLSYDSKENLAVAEAQDLTLVGIDLASEDPSRAGSLYQKKAWEQPLRLQAVASTCS